MNPEHGPEQSSTPEALPTDHPRIYIASLSDYVAGALHGTWIDARQDADEIWNEVNDMLQRSPSPGAEEIALHDYDGFGPLHLSEYERIETLSTLAQGIEAHGMAFAHLAQLLDRVEWDELGRFEELYLGTWNSMEEYAEELLQDMGIDVDTIGPEILQPYVRVDLDRFAEDLADDYLVAETDDGVHLFDRE
jgi:antirestriction protein